MTQKKKMEEGKDGDKKYFTTPKRKSCAATKVRKNIVFKNLSFHSRCEMKIESD